jgi:hypothetical protein
MENDMIKHRNNISHFLKRKYFESSLIKTRIISEVKRRGNGGWGIYENGGNLEIKKKEKKMGVEAKNSLTEEFNDLRKIEMKMEIVHLLDKWSSTKIMQRWSEESKR